MRLLLIIFLLFQVSAYAQNGQTKPSIDPFTGNVQVNSIWTKHFMQGGCAAVSFHRNGNLVTMHFQFSSFNHGVFGVTPNSEMLLKLANDSVVSLSCLDVAISTKNGGVSGWDCMNAQGLKTRFMVSQAALELMMEHDPKLLRFNTTGGYIDIGLSQQPETRKALIYVMSAK